MLCFFVQPPCKCVSADKDGIKLHVELLDDNGVCDGDGSCADSCDDRENKGWERRSESAASTLLTVSALITRQSPHGDGLNGAVVTCMPFLALLCCVSGFDALWSRVSSSPVYPYTCLYSRRISSCSFCCCCLRRINPSLSSCRSCA